MAEDPRQAKTWAAFYSQFENADHFHENEEYTVPDWWDITSQHVEKYKPEGTPLDLQHVAGEPEPKEPEMDDDE